MNSSQIPEARQDGLVIQKLPEEVLVYDLEINKAHCLNETAAFVWEACDGKNSVADIARLFGSHSGTKIQEDFIWLAIDQLNEKKLLKKEIAVSFNGQSRRDVIKKIGLAAVIALPIVSSLIAPVAASAITGACVANTNCTCTLGTTCMTVGGCPCNGGNSTSNTGCSTNCATGGCQCNVANGSASCGGNGTGLCSA